MAIVQKKIVFVRYCKWSGSVLFGLLNCIRFFVGYYYRMGFVVVDDDDVGVVFVVVILLVVEQMWSILSTCRHQTKKILLERLNQKIISQKCIL